MEQQCSAMGQRRSRWERDGTKPSKGEAARGLLAPPCPLHSHPASLLAPPLRQLSLCCRQVITSVLSGLSRVS